MGTIIVLIVVLAMVYFAARSVIRDKKAGKCSGGCSGCGGGCSGCGGGCVCGQMNENSKCSIAADKKI